MKELIKVWSIRIIILAAVVYAGWRWGTPVYKEYFTTEKEVAFVPTSQVKKGDFAVSFHEIGSLDAEKSVAVMCMNDGKIIKLVKDGVFVKKGERLVELDTSDMENDVRNAKLTYKNAQADVDQAKSDLDILVASDKTGMDEAQADLDFAQTSLKRSQDELAKKKRLAEDKLVTKDSVTAAETDVLSSQLNVTKQQMALVLQKEKNDSAESQQKAKVEKAEFAAAIQKNALDDVLKRMSLSTIDAPASGLAVLGETYDGMSGTRKLQEGDQARRRQIICTLPDLSSMLVKVKLGESDAPRVHLAMPVLIRLDAVPNRIFKGTVKSIASLARTPEPWEGGTGRKEIEVVIGVSTSKKDVLKPGMSADVEFICQSIKNAVYVPIEAVIERDGKTMAYVKDGTAFHKQVVKTGIANDSFIAITDGLEKGQIIALRDPTKPLESQRNASQTEQQKKKEQLAPVPSVGKK
jgi:multidrug efflux pump subunit AcrA (membrane-fusion protein)